MKYGMLSRSIWTSDVTVAIVNFNTKDLLRNCLNSIFKNTNKLKIEVLVVDNGSRDGSASMVQNQFPKVYLIKNSKNLFFSKAYNQTLRISRGKYFLVLNSDTKLFKNSLGKIYQFMENHPKIAAVGCRQINNDGKLDLTCSRFPTPIIEFFESNIIGRIFKYKRIHNKYRYGNWLRNTTKSVDVIPGSFMLIKTNVIKQLNGFDENLLLFYSDYDLCLRIKKLGYLIYYYPAATIVHNRSGTIRKINPWQLTKISLSDMLYYYKKHFGTFWWLFLWLIYRPNWLYWRLKSMGSNIFTD